MPSLHVAKIGGSSVANAERVQHSLGRVLEDPRRRVVAISAPGQMNGSRKVTDDLRAIAGKLLEGSPLDEPTAQRVEQRYQCLERKLYGRAIVSATFMDTVRERTTQVVAQRRMDPLEAVGEETMYQIAARAAQQMTSKRIGFVDAREFMLVEERGSPIDVAFVPPAHYPGIRSRLGDALGKYDIVFTPGYCGRTRDGRIRVFQRGGGDYTGAVESAALNAALYENFTDVDGIRAIDYKPLRTCAPRISHMGLEELAELTLGGSFGVFQADAVAPLARARIPVHIQSTLEPGEGTWILPDNQLDPAYVESHPVRGIAFRPRFALLDVLQFDMGQDPGYLRAMAGVFAERRVSLEHMPTSQIRAAAIAREAALGDVHAIEQALRDATQADRVTSQPNLGIVSIVGQALPRLTGFAGRVFSWLGEAGINIQTISYAGGINLIVGMPNGQAEHAVEVLFDRIYDNGPRLMYKGI